MRTLIATPVNNDAAPMMKPYPYIYMHRITRTYARNYSTPARVTYTDIPADYCAYIAKWIARQPVCQRRTMPRRVDTHHLSRIAHGRNVNIFRGDLGTGEREREREKRERLRNDGQCAELWWRRRWYKKSKIRESRHQSFKRDKQTDMAFKVSRGDAELAIFQNSSKCGSVSVIDKVQFVWRKKFNFSKVLLRIVFLSFVSNDLWISKYMIYENFLIYSKTNGEKVGR